MPRWKWSSCRRFRAGLTSLQRSIGSVWLPLSMTSRARRQPNSRRAACSLWASRPCSSKHPHTRPNRPKKSPASRFHAATKSAREALRKAYGLFLAAFREAAERLRAGDRNGEVPQRLLSAGLAFRPCVSDRTAAAVIGVTERHSSRSFQAWTTPQGRGGPSECREKAPRRREKGLIEAASGSSIGQESARKTLQPRPRRRRRTIFRSCLLHSAGT